MTYQISSELHLYIIIIFLFVKYGYRGLMTERKALWMSKTMCYITLNCDFLQELFKYCLHSKSFDAYSVSFDLYSKCNHVIANIYLYLYNVLTMWVILIYGVYLRMIRCYEEKMSDFRLQTEESESSSDSFKDWKDTRERIRLLQLESERHLMIF